MLNYIVNSNQSMAFILQIQMAEEQSRLEQNKYIILSPRSWNGIAWSPKKSVEMAPESHDTIFSSTASSSRRTQWVEIFSGKLCLFVSMQHLWCFNEVFGISVFLQFSYYRIVNRCTPIEKIGKTLVLPRFGGYTRSAKPSSLPTVIQNGIFGLLIFCGEILFKNRIFAYHRTS